MDCVHFEVIKFSIDGMLRLGVEMELKSFVLFRGTIDLLGDVGHERHTWVLFASVEIDLDGVSVEFGRRLPWILIDFSELIG
jgi:hypothetical protein